MVALGILCGLITVVLFSSLQIMKKLLRRMERVNTLIQIQAVAIAVFAVALLLIVQYSINFDGPAASSVITEDMPWHFHERYYIVGFLLLAISLVAFMGSYYEFQFLFTINTLICSIGIIALIILAITNEVTSSMIRGNLDSKCSFAIPQFSQDMLMEFGCSAKYKTTAEKIQDLTCPKEQIARVWESNINLRIEDQKDTYGCVNQECCVEVKAMIQGRFSMLTVSCIVLALFIFYFIVNQQYMVKVIQRYQARILNHNGDTISLFIIFVCILLYVGFRFYGNFQQIGPPEQKFEYIVPKGSNVYSYYGIQNPKQKKEP